MNTTHIKSFLYVSKYNSISKAADPASTTSTSTIYEHILASLSKMKSALLCTNKANRGIYLTENGEIFLEYANKILDIVDDIHRRILQVQRDASNHGQRIQRLFRHETAYE